MKPGDIVRLKSGGPLLIVIVATGSLIWVSWESDHGTMVDSIYEVALEPGL